MPMRKGIIAASGVPVGFDIDGFMSTLIDGEYFRADTNVFTDAAGLFPVASDFDPIGRWNGVRGNYHVATANPGDKPVWRDTNHVAMLPYKYIFSPALSRVTRANEPSFLFVYARREALTGFIESGGNKTVGLFSALGYVALALSPFGAGEDLGNIAGHGHPADGAGDNAWSINTGSPANAGFYRGAVFIRSDVAGVGGVYKSDDDFAVRHASMHINEFNADSEYIVMRGNDFTTPLVKMIAMGSGAFTMNDMLGLLSYARALP